MIRSAIIIGFLFSIYFSSNEIFAQPFSEVEAGFSLSRSSILDDSYSSRWNLTNSYSFSARTPFYIGIIGLEVGLFDYLSKDPLLSDFSSISYSISLHSRAQLPKPFSLYLGAGTGIQKTSIYSELNPTERELFYSAKFEPRIEFNYLIIFGTFDYMKVYNFNRQHILFCGGGFRIKVFLPKNWQNIIQ